MNAQARAKEIEQQRKDYATWWQIWLIAALFPVYWGGFYFTWFVFGDNTIISLLRATVFGVGTLFAVAVDGMAIISAFVLLTTRHEYNRLVTQINLDEAITSSKQMIEMLDKKLYREIYEYTDRPKVLSTTPWDDFKISKTIVPIRPERGWQFVRMPNS